MNRLHTRNRILGLAAMFAFATLALEAQKGGSQGGGGATGAGAGAGAGGGITTPGRPTGPTTTNPNYPSNNPSMIPEMQRPIFLSGKVILDDGTPPPSPVVMELLCSGNPRPQGYTDSKGRFSFQLGQNSDVMADASYSSGPGLQPGGGSFGGANTMNSMGGMGGRSSLGGNSDAIGRGLLGCELRASLAGFRSDTVSLVNHRSLDNPDVGTIVLHRMANVEGLTISATSTMAPKDARKAYEKGLEHERKNKLDDAEKNFQKAVDIYPKYAAAWSELGRIHEMRNEPDDARKAYAQALAADSKFVNPYEGMYRLAARENKWQEVADTSNRVIHLNAFDFPGAYFYNAVANLNLHNLDAAEKSAREAVKLDARHQNPKEEHLLGIILAQKQDYTGAAQHLQAFLKLVPEGKESEQVKQQLEEVQKVAQTQAPQPAAPATKP